MINKIISCIGSVPADKVLHFAVSTIVTAVSVAVAHLCWANQLFVIITSAIVISAVGLAKEYLIDTQADPWDLVANYAGAAVIWGLYLIIS